MTMKSWTAVLAVALVCFFTDSAHARPIRVDLFGWTATGASCTIVGSCDTANVPPSLDNGIVENDGGPLPWMAFAPGVTGDTYALYSLSATQVTDDENNGDGTFYSSDGSQADAGLKVQWFSSTETDQEAVVYVLTDGNLEIDYDYNGGLSECPSKGSFTVGDVTYSGPVPSDCSDADEPTFIVNAGGIVTSLPQGWAEATAVPEPPTFALLGMALPGFALWFYARRRDSRARWNRERAKA